MREALMAPGISLIPLTETFGAEVRGVDLNRPLPPETEAVLRDAYRRHQLLLFRGRAVSAPDQTRLAQLFGELVMREHNLVKPTDVGEQTVSNVRPDGVFGQGEMSFHMDQTFYPDPLNTLILYGVEIPPDGGDTLFCDMAAVHDDLPEALRQKLEGISCRYRRRYDEATATRYNVSMAPETISSSEHPAIVTNPETGRRCVWVTGTQVAVLGVPEEEGAALIAEVRRRIEGSAFIYRHQWRRDDLVLWNNRILQHARTPFDSTQPRTLRRSAVLRAANAEALAVPLPA